MNPFLDLKSIKEAFRNAHMEENHSFLEEDLDRKSTRLNSSH